MGNLLFWMGIGATQKAAGPKEVKPTDRHQVISIIVGILFALLICAAVFILLVSQK
jgi:hypothetical protein